MEAILDWVLFSPFQLMWNWVLSSPFQKLVLKPTNFISIHNLRILTCESWAKWNQNFKEKQFWVWQNSQQNIPSQRNCDFHLENFTKKSNLIPLKYDVTLTWKEHHEPFSEKFVKYKQRPFSFTDRLEKQTQDKFFLIAIHSMQGWTATTRDRVAIKRNTKRLKYTGNHFTNSLQLKGVT